MADKLEYAEFWLPSEFLTDEDILMDNKENFNKHGIAGSNSAGHCFPIEFPYDFGSCVLSSPVESSSGSAETESDEEDSLLTGLTRQLTLSEIHKLTPANQNHEKGRVLSSSPQSTLTQVGSWSGGSTVSSSGSPDGPSQVSSPPTTPLSAKNDAWDLIYQAAGQVARLKMNGRDGPTGNPGLPGPQKWLITPPPPKTPAGSSFHHCQWQQVRGEEMLKQTGRGMWSRPVKSKWSLEQEVHNRTESLGVGGGSWNVNGGGFDPPSAWPSLQVQQRNQQQLGELGVREGMCIGSGYGYGYGFGSTGGGGCGGGLKRERTGTGVFLPRRYGNISNPSNTSDSRKKPGSSPVNLHPMRVMQDLNKIGSVAQPQPQARMNLGSATDYDTLIARRNALLIQKRRNLRAEGSVCHEICLPQEWTY